MISSFCNLIEFFPQIYFSNFERIILRQFMIVSILVYYFQFLFLEISLYNKVYQKRYIDSLKMQIDIEEKMNAKNNVDYQSNLWWRKGFRL